METKSRDEFDADGRPIPIFVPPPQAPSSFTPFKPGPGQPDRIAELERAVERLSERVLALERALHER